jgi:hypothetical protein
MLALIFFAALVTGKMLQQSITLETPAFLGKFVGGNVTYELGCRLEEGAQEKSAEEVRLHFFLVDEPSKARCEQSAKAIEVYVHKHGSWNRDVQGSVQANGAVFAYLLDCHKQLEPGMSFAVKLYLKDSDTLHFSYEVYKVYWVSFTFLALYLFYIGSAIYLLYKERHEEVPLTIVFVIALLMLLSLIFQMLFMWIYTLDGASYKFIRIFGDFFEVFARIALVGMVMLFAAGKFNPKDFSIEEMEFVVFLLMVASEFFIGIVAVTRSAGMEEFDMWGRAEGWILLIERGFFFLMMKKFKGNKNVKLLDGFERVDTIGGMYIMQPLFMIIIYWGAGFAWIGTLLYGVDKMWSFFLLCYIIQKVFRFQFSGVLPFKTHKF